MPRIAAATAVLLLLVAVGAWVGLDRVQANAVADRAVAITGGDPDRGRRLIADKGCGLCHTVPGVPRADGLVGPNLARVGSRVYVAGVIANSPGNMIRWLRDPPGVDPMTAMPNLGLTEPEARDITAYLYTLD
jgi:cytochrome c1